MPLFGGHNLLIMKAQMKLILGGVIAAILIIIIGKGAPITQSSEITALTLDIVAFSFRCHEY